MFLRSLSLLSSRVLFLSDALFSVFSFFASLVFLILDCHCLRDYFASILDSGCLPVSFPRSVIIVLSLFPSASLFFGSLFYPIIVSIPHVAASRANKQTNGKAPRKAQVGEAVSFRSRLFDWNAALRMSADSGLGRRSSPCATCVAFPN